MLMHGTRKLFANLSSIVSVDKSRASVTRRVKWWSHTKTRLFIFTATSLMCRRRSWESRDLLLCSDRCLFIFRKSDYQLHWTGMRPIISIFRSAARHIFMVRLKVCTKSENENSFDNLRRSASHGLEKIPFFHLPSFLLLCNELVMKKGGENNIQHRHVDACSWSVRFSLPFFSMSTGDSPVFLMLRNWIYNLRSCVILQQELKRNQPNTTQEWTDKGEKSCFSKKQ